MSWRHNPSSPRQHNKSNNSASSQSSPSVKQTQSGSKSKPKASPNKRRSKKRRGSKQNYDHSKYSSMKREYEETIKSLKSKNQVLNKKYRVLAQSVSYHPKSKLKSIPEPTIDIDNNTTSTKFIDSPKNKLTKSQKQNAVNLQSQIQTLKKSVTKIKNDFNVMNDFDTLTSEINTEISTHFQKYIKSLNDKHKAETKKSQKYIKSLNNKHKEEIKEFKNKFEQVQNEMDKLKADLAESQNGHRASVKVLRATEHDLSSTKDELHRAQDLKKQNSVRLRSLQRKLCQAQKTKDQIESENAKLREENEKLKEKETRRKKLEANNSNYTTKFGDKSRRKTWTGDASFAKATDIHKIALKIYNGHNEMRTEIAKLTEKLDVIMSRSPGNSRRSTYANSVFGTPPNEKLSPSKLALPDNPGTKFDFKFGDFAKPSDVNKLINIIENDKNEILEQIINAFDKMEKMVERNHKLVHHRRHSFKNSKKRHTLPFAFGFGSPTQALSINDSGNNGVILELGQVPQQVLVAQRHKCLQIRAELQSLNRNFVQWKKRADVDFGQIVFAFTSVMRESKKSKKLISKLRSRHSVTKWKAVLKEFGTPTRKRAASMRTPAAKPFVVRSLSGSSKVKPSISRSKSVTSEAVLATELKVNEARLHYFANDLEFKRGEIKEIRNTLNDIRHDYGMWVESSSIDLAALMEMVSDRFAKQKMMDNNNKLEIKQLRHHLTIARKMNVTLPKKTKSAPIAIPVSILAPSTSAKATNTRSVSFVTTTTSPVFSDDNTSVKQIEIRKKIIMVKKDFKSIKGSFEKVQIFMQKFTNLHRVEMVHIKHMILKGMKKERQRAMRQNQGLKTHRISPEKLNKLQGKLRGLLNGLNDNMEIAFNVMNKMRNKNEVNIKESARFINLAKQQRVFNFELANIDENRNQNENVPLKANSEFKPHMITKKNYEEIKSGHKVYLKLLEKSMKQKKKYSTELDNVLNSTKEHRRLLKVKIADMEQVLKAMYHDSA